MNRARIGVIYCAGLEELCSEGREFRVGTPYGPPPPMHLVTVGDADVAFVSRPGVEQSRPPHRINHRANIWALHELGVERIIGIDVVQRMGKRSRRKRLVVPDDVIDLAGRPNSTFYDEGLVVQIDMDQPFCREIRSVLLDSSANTGIEAEDKSTYVCVDGPRFRTPAEVRAIKTLGGDILGMALVPEVFLARELGMCYAALTVPFEEMRGKAGSASAVRFIETARNSSKTLRDIVTTAIKKMPSRRKCPCTKALEGTLV